MSVNSDITTQRTHDVNGIEYAKLSQLKAGDQIKLDGGFG